MPNWQLAQTQTRLLTYKWPKAVSRAYPPERLPARLYPKSRPAKSRNKAKKPLRLSLQSAGPTSRPVPVQFLRRLDTLTQPACCHLPSNSIDEYRCLPSTSHPRLQPTITTRLVVLYRNQPTTCHLYLSTLHTTISILLGLFLPIAHNESRVVRISPSSSWPLFLSSLANLSLRHPEYRCLISPTRPSR